MSMFVRKLPDQSKRLLQRSASDLTALSPSARKLPAIPTGGTYGAKSIDPQRSQELLRVTSRPLARLPTKDIVRNLLLGVFFSSPALLKPGFAILRAIAESRSGILNPDRNPILRIILKPLIYDHFCAGTNHAEIQQTRDRIKAIGYSGVILSYAKETQISQSNELLGAGSVAAREMERWMNGNFETIDMMGSGDWLGIKLTGAGKAVSRALMNVEEPPAELVAAIDSICQRVAAKGCRIWIDSEQQVVQPGIDRWTIALMRRYNKDGRALVFNTLQAYLKASREKLMEQLSLSHREGWTLGIKLVRGAYIDSDPRELIHDSKINTDNSYNGIVRDLLKGTNLGFDESQFPKNIELVLAGHNPDSISNAQDLVQSLSAQGRLKVVPDFAQLQGMGDVTGCKFLSQCEANDARSNGLSTRPVKMGMYKYLTWGTMQECMHYLFRRAVENSSGGDRIRNDLEANWREYKHRVFGGK